MLYQGASLAEAIAAYERVLPQFRACADPALFSISETTGSEKIVRDFAVYRQATILENGLPPLKRQSRSIVLEAMMLDAKTGQYMTRVMFQNQ